MSRCPKIGILKVGCIASSPLLEYMLDERAERDIEMRTWSTGAKMDVDSCKQVASEAVKYAPDLLLVISPNAGLEGPTAIRQKAEDAELSCLSISDAPSLKAFVKKGKDSQRQSSLPETQGFLVVPSDPLIGARREFLDATEMVIFNSDVMKVLAVCGVVRCVHSKIDGVVDSIQKGIPIEMPRAVIDTNLSIQYANLGNPYAKAKAIAALKIAEQVAQLTSIACFRVSDPHEYVPLVAAAHEMMRTAAKLADEIREIEKAQDTVHRSPHSDDGSILSKSGLNEKPR